MESAQPTAQHKKLEALAGNWSGEETVHPSPWGPGGPSIGRYDNRIDLDGFVLIQNYVQEQSGEVSYRGHGIYGWDPAQERYLMCWADNTGCLPAKAVPGTWDGDVLTFRERGPAGHVRYAYTFDGDDAFEFRLDRSADGETWEPYLEGRYRRG
jgi:hypothetical protein